MHHGRRVGASGILESATAESALPSLMQTRIRILPGRPIFQTPIDPVVLGEYPALRRPTIPAHFSGEGRRGASVRTLCAVEIRDRSDVTIDADMITVSLTVIPDHVVWQLCRRRAVGP